MLELSYKAEGPRHIARHSPSIIWSWLVATRWKNSNTESSRLVKPIRSQRVYFDGGPYPRAVIGLMTRSGATTEVDSRPFMVVRASFGQPCARTAGVMSWLGAATKTSSTGRCFLQFDRKTDCFRKGRGNPFGVEGKRVRAECPQSAHGLDASQSLPPFTETVCGTQTRMPRGFKSAAQDGPRPERTGLSKTPPAGEPETTLKRPSWFLGSWTVDSGKAPC